MPINQVFFAAVLMATMIFVFSRGDRPEKLAALLFMVAAISTPITQLSRFDKFEIFIAFIDIGVFLASVGIAYFYKKSSLFLTCSMLLLVVLSHFARLIAGPVNGWAYGSLMAMCSYMSLAALAWSSFVTAKGRLPALLPDRPDQVLAAGSTLPTASVGEAILPKARSESDVASIEEAQSCVDAPSGSAKSETALLARLLSFYGCAEQASALSSLLIQKAGSLGAVVRAPPDRLARWGATPEVVTAIGLAGQILKVTLKREIFNRPVFSSSMSVLDYFQSELSSLDREEIHVLHLNNHFECIHIERHSQGTINHAPFFPREIMRSALDVGAVHLILAHNHPSNDPQPSRTDIQFTRELRDMLKPVGISLLDHLIVARRGHSSMASAGLM